LFLYFLKQQKTIEQEQVEKTAEAKIAIGPNFDQIFWIS